MTVRLNGPTEGHINRLKLIKRSLYGRAKFPLLRARVLHMAERGVFSHRLMPLDGDALPVAERRFKKGEQVREQEEHDGAIDPIWEDIS